MRASFHFRLSDTRRDRVIAAALDGMMRDGVDASEWAKGVLYAAVTGEQIAPLARLAGEMPHAQEDPQTAGALDALGGRFR